jgi:hypothetical protein
MSRVNVASHSDKKEMLVTRIHTLAAAVAVAWGVAACGNETPSNVPAPKVGGTTATEAMQSSLPSAPTDRDAPPAATPSTHSGDPQPEAAPAPTARDTAANRPMDDLTKSKESSSLPMAGQVNNHSSTATDRPNKTTPQDGDAKTDKP